MKVDNQDIVRMARQLRDEENATQHVSPWRRHRRFAVPTRLVALPASVVIGFILGIWTNVRTQSDAPLTALVDTVYIKVNDKPDTSHVTKPRALTVRPARRPRPRAIATGHPMQSDRIGYDLLVKN